MTTDARATRSSARSSVDDSIEDRQDGPADELGLVPHDALHPAVECLRSVIDGVPCEEATVLVEATTERLHEQKDRARFSAVVRLIVRGPRTRSPVLWQHGGTRLDVEAWAADLSTTLPDELAAVATGEPLAGPWTGTVVLDPWVASLLIHECIGHTSEADNYLDYASPTGRSLGWRWTGAPLTVTDDPTEPGRIASYMWDDEGQPAARTTVVHDGVWTDLLHDSRSAATLPATRSGNGRRVAGAETAIPRMSVLTVHPGNDPIEQLIGDVDDGWYCSGSWGAGSTAHRFVLRPTLARRIRAGRVERRYLRRFELRGNKFDTIAAIDAIGDVTRHFDPAFGCDKNEQNDLPVAQGAPHLRLRGVTLVPLGPGKRVT